MLRAKVGAIFFAAMVGCAGSALADATSNDKLRQFMEQVRPQPAASQVGVNDHALTMEIAGLREQNNEFLEALTLKPVIPETGTLETSLDTYLIVTPFKLPHGQATLAKTDARGVSRGD